MTSDEEALSVRLLSLTISGGLDVNTIRLFQQAGMPPPVIDWEVTRRSLPDPRLAVFWDTWMALPRRSDLPIAAAFDLEALSSVRDWVIWVDLLDAEADCYYRLHGSGVAKLYGRDMTGRRGSDFGGQIARFFTATYLAVGRRRRPLFTEHRPPPSVPVEKWWRVILPMVDADDRVAQFLVGIVPSAVHGDTGAADPARAG